MSTDWWHLAGAIVPSILVTVLFIVLVRAIITGDRREREAERRPDEAGYERTSRIPTEIDRSE